MICYALDMATSKRKDFTQTALDVVRKATGETTAPTTSKKPAGGHKELATTPRTVKKKRVLVR